MTNWVVPSTAVNDWATSREWKARRRWFAVLLLVYRCSFALANDFNLYHGPAWHTWQQICFARMRGGHAGPSSLRWWCSAAWLVHEQATSHAAKRPLICFCPKGVVNLSNTGCFVGNYKFNDFNIVHYVKHCFDLIRFICYLQLNWLCLFRFRYLFLFLFIPLHLFHFQCIFL